MPRTPQDFGGPLLEDEIRFYDQYGTLPAQEGAMLFSDGYFYAYDQYGVFNLRQDQSAGGDDELVKVSSNDTTADYLLNKLVAGPNFFIAEQNDGGNETLLLDAYGFTTGALKYHYLIWAEENGGIANGQEEWSFGNGATGSIGIPIYADGYLLGMTYNAESAGDATTEVEVYVNGATVGGSIVPGNGVNSATTTFSTPIQVSAGDLIGFHTITGGGASDVRVAVVVEHEIEVTGLKGDKGDVGPSGPADSKWLDAYDDAGGISIPDAWTDITWDAQRKVDSPYSHTLNSAEITIDEYGTYGIWARVSTCISSGSNRTESEMQLLWDRGSGYTVIPGSTAYLYNRTVAQGCATGVAFLTLDMLAGDKIKVQARRASGSSDLETAPDGSSIIIQKVVPGTLAGNDELVKVSANDTSASYLFSKIVAGTGITVAELNDGSVETLEVALDTHAPTHIKDGSDEIDGDQLDIDFTPTFYEPTIVPSEVDDYDHLTAHLAGIDAYLGSIQGGGGINDAEHRALRHLIHFINDGPALEFASGAFKETLPAGSPFPTSVIWWESAAKLEKIVELTITRTGIFPTTEEWVMYDTDGSTVLETVTDTIVYSGPFEINRTRTIA